MKLLMVLLFLIPIVYANEVAINMSVPVVLDECDISITIETSKSSYDQEPIKFTPKLNQDVEVFEIEYWIEDTEGSLLKKKTITKNLNQKSFTPNKNQPATYMLIKSEFTTTCKGDELKLSAEKKITYRHPEKTQEPRTSVNLTEEKEIEEVPQFHQYEPKTEGINISANTTVYESKSAKSKNLIKYIIIAVLAALCTVLIWKR